MNSNCSVNQVVLFIVPAVFASWTQGLPNNIASCGVVIPMLSEVSSTCKIFNLSCGAPMRETQRVNRIISRTCIS